MSPYRVMVPRRPVRTFPWWTDYLLDRFEWYRRFCGGHWELWWNDLTHSMMWFQREHSDERPPCCFGTPKCEDHP